MKAFPLICLLMVLPLAAEESRLAVVDMTRLFNAHPDTKAAEERVTEARAEARKSFLKTSETLKKALQEHQDLLLAGKTAEAGKKLEAIRGLERELALVKSTRERDLENQFLEEKRKILAQVKEAVRAVNAEAGYVLVLDRSAAAESGIPMVVDVRGLADITDVVMARFKK
ncbi:MAG: OmpH family outer membrane protein [Akkermansiaceae bacterium]|nr:OmpH family outer membrane protein [Akkermansiaceae bacterium]